MVLNNENQVIQLLNNYHLYKVEVVRFVLPSTAPYLHYENNKNQAHLLNLLLTHYHLYEVKVEVKVEVEVEVEVEVKFLWH